MYVTYRSNYLLVYITQLHVTHRRSASSAQRFHKRHKLEIEIKRSQPLIYHNKSSYDRYNRDCCDHSNLQLMVSILLSKTDNIISFKRKEGSLRVEKKSKAKKKKRNINNVFTYKLNGKWCESTENGPEYQNGRFNVLQSTGYFIRPPPIPRVLVKNIEGNTIQHPPTYAHSTENLNDSNLELTPLTLGDGCISNNM
uniref:Uncharacterized protein n=1 Tax=Glossina austeni TaxID=7395 RepID=A0A1A9V8W7_GLOAU